MNFINFLKQKITFKSVLLTLTSLFFLFIIYYGTMAQVSRPELCTICHMMKPEFYSWQASSHEKVPCLSCHEARNTENQLKTLYYAITNTYMAPIIMTTTIPDRKCESCHKVNKRKVTPSGDLIIPHAAHKAKNIACAKCHRGVAHAHISERKVTYKTDYSKWDSTLAKALMTDDQTRTRMDTCMRCHEARKAPLDCKACHRTSMLPQTHKSKEFKYVNHGQMAAGDLKSCDKCHSFMSTEKYEGFQEVSAIDKFLQSSNKSQKAPDAQETNKVDITSARSYAKINTYCRACHRKRPPSHGENFTKHSEYAKANRDKCMTCHDNRKNDNSVVKVGCGTCHPALHAKSWQWKVSHPIKLVPGQEVVESCYRCHVKKRCGSCHKTLPSQPTTQ